MLNDMTDIPVREVGNPLLRRRRGSSGLLLVAADSFSARRIMISLFVVLVMLGIVAGCAAPAAPAPVAGPLAGDWPGSIEVPDQPLDIGVHLTGEESLAGTIDVPAMGVIAAPLAEVQRDGDRVGFTIPDVPGAPAFSGTLRIDALVGDFTQAGQSFPVTLTRGALAGLGEVPDQGIDPQGAGERGCTGNVRDREADPVPVPLNLCKRGRDHSHRRDVNGPCQRLVSREVDPDVQRLIPVSYTHLRAHETASYLVCRL